jgi:probable F420-dependent oxidoreductase
VRAYAQAAQELGFAHLLAYDHVLGGDLAAYPHLAGRYNVDSLFHEPFVLFAYLAAVAPKLELVTGVIVLPQRQTALVAKQAAEVDVLTGGRFRLGVGIGWNELEYEGLGMDFRTRGRRLDEQIELLRRYFTEPVVTFEGRFDRVTAAGINPLPVQRPIPIWIGASAEVGLRRAARVADGLFTLRPPEGMEWPEVVERLREMLAEEGRDPGSFGLEHRLNFPGGTPDDWRAEADRWRALGATHLSINTMGGGLVGPDAHIGALREAAAALLG